MGRPVKWLYSAVLEPGVQESKLSLYRVQEGTDTRFLWLTVAAPGLVDLPGIDDVLQNLYAGLLEMMQETV